MSFVNKAYLRELNQYGTVVGSTLAVTSEEAEDQAYRTTIDELNLPGVNYSSYSGFEVIKFDNQIILPSGSDTDIIFETKIFDINNEFDSVEFSPTVTGVYHFTSLLAIYSADFVSGSQIYISIYSDSAVNQKTIRLCYSTDYSYEKRFTIQATGLLPVDVSLSNVVKVGVKHNVSNGITVYGSDTSTIPSVFSGIRIL